MPVKYVCYQCSTHGSASVKSHKETKAFGGVKGNELVGKVGKVYA
jgi:hypothetical protein